MKVRIYAVTPETEAGQMDVASGVIECEDSQQASLAVLRVMQLYPQWSEINIEQQAD